MGGGARSGLAELVDYTFMLLGTTIQLTMNHAALKGEVPPAVSGECHGKHRRGQGYSRKNSCDIRLY